MPNRALLEVNIMQESNSLQPNVRMLSQELTERIVTEAKEVLEKVGVKVENEEGLALLGNGGARIDRDKKQALISKRLVEQCLKTVPSRLQMYDRNGEPHMNLEGDNVYFNWFPPHKMWDPYLKKLREPVTEDAVNAIRLVDALDSIDGQYPFPGSDVPREIWDCYKFFLSVKYSTKPSDASLHWKDSFNVFKELLLVIRGNEKSMREKPMLLMPACPSPPLKWSDLVCFATMRAAEAGIPPLIMSMPLAGATSPLTIAGTIVQHTAEVLSAVVITQLINPGVPMVWSSSPAALDMRYATPPMGAMETMLINMGATQVGKYLGIPTNTLMGSDSKQPDSQAGLEAGISTVLAGLSGVNLISGASMLNFQTTFSLEKLVIDNEICRMTRRLLRGIAPRGEKLAEDLFTERLYDPKHFLLSPLTTRWLRDELSFPWPVIDREDDQKWMGKGQMTAEERAKDEAKRILAAHEPPPLDPNMDRELTAVMTKAAMQYGMNKLPLPQIKSMR
jgi:trimethylamine--corrinoid protein Co-methyltransferase